MQRYFRQAAAGDIAKSFKTIYLLQRTEAYIMQGCHAKAHLTLAHNACP